MMTWPDEHVHWQGIIPAAPEYALPFAVHVFILKSSAHLREATGDPNVCARSTTYAEPDTDNIGALLMFTLEDLHLSLAAHEATHVALLHHSNTERSRVGAKRWLAGHPESIAEMTGNLTALVWAALAEHGGDDE